MRDLRLYRQKRDPGTTPEPFGDERSARVLPPDAPRAFCVQQHAATRMHWDLRLEIGEVLVSWAVPRGPTLDPEEKRLAVQTEDHPREYADFEGVIPAGNYGAGAMILWDRGVYRCVDGVLPEEGLAQGKLDLLLLGHKLRGRFALVRTARGEGRDWLLLYKGEKPDEAGELVERQPRSVWSGLDVEELAAGRTRERAVRDAARRAGAPRAPLDAAALRPMLAKREEGPFDREGWIYEVKYDGVRVLAARRGDDVRLRVRTGVDRTGVYPEIVRALAALPVSQFVLDGEVVVLDDSGRPSFERIQRRFTQTDPDAMAAAAAAFPGVLFAFDLLEVGGRDVRGLPLLARKRLLSRFVPEVGVARYAEHVERDGVALYDAVSELGLEGIVAKRGDAAYDTGRRSDRWKKIKVPRTARLAIVGCVGGKGSRHALGSLMVAWRRPADGGFVYAGNVGSGLAERDVAELLPLLEARRRSLPAFEGSPDLAPHERTFFVEPDIVCEVRFTETTSAGHLRHPVFLGVQSETDPGEATAPPTVDDAIPTVQASVPRRPVEPELEITRREKVFWPTDGYTKGDLLDYYERAWPHIGPYLRDRPLVLTRYPDGIDGKHFYQQNAPSFTPDWATRQEIDGTDFFLCNDLRTLLYVINSGAIPLHVWSARVTDLDRPDWLILDLDPKSAPFSDVVRVARHIHRLLDDQGAPHYVKTSGQDGLHVLLPMGAALDHDAVRTLAEVLARLVCEELPEIATITRPVAARGDKVYVDYLQNGRGKLIAAPFSARPRAGAPVSMPLTWSQVTSKLSPSRFTIKTAPRLTEKREDPLRAVLEQAVDVSGLLEALSDRLGAASEDGS